MLVEIRIRKKDATAALPGCTTIARDEHMRLSQLVERGMAGAAEWSRDFVACPERHWREPLTILRYDRLVQHRAVPDAARSGPRRFWRVRIVAGGHPQTRAPIVGSH